MGDFNFLIFYVFQILIDPGTSENTEKGKYQKVCARMYHIQTAESKN